MESGTLKYPNDTDTKLTVIVARGRRIRRQKEKLHLLANGSSAVVRATESFAVRDMAYQRRIGASFA